MSLASNARWYILQVRSGHEAHVLKIIDFYHEDENIEEIFVPSIASCDSKLNSRKKVLPGYIFIKMHINEDILKKFSSIHFVYKFLSQDDKPKIIPDDEVERLKDSVRDFNLTLPTSKKFNIGDDITIIDGPFESYSGKIEELDEEKEQVKVKILFFGRSVVVSFKISQLKLVN